MLAEVARARRARRGSTRSWSPATCSTAGWSTRPRSAPACRALERLADVAPVVAVTGNHDDPDLWIAPRALPGAAASSSPRGCAPATTPWSRSTTPAGPAARGAACRGPSRRAWPLHVGARRPGRARALRRPGGRRSWPTTRRGASRRRRRESGGGGGAARPPHGRAGAGRRGRARADAGPRPTPSRRPPCPATSTTSPSATSTGRSPCPGSPRRAATRAARWPSTSARTGTTRASRWSSSDATAAPPHPEVPLAAGRPLVRLRGRSTGWPGSPPSTPAPGSPARSSSSR